jgi:hypothetical protein
VTGRFARRNKVDKQKYLIVIVNETTGRGTSFEVNTANMPTLVKAFQKVAEGFGQPEMPKVKVTASAADPETQRGE